MDWSASPPTLPFQLHQFIYSVPTNIAFPPLPIHLLTAFNNAWWSHKYSNSTSISVSRSASKNDANSGRFEVEPSSSSRPTLHCCFFFSSQVMISYSHFDLFVWTVTCPYLALRPVASEHANLCAHPVIAFFPFQLNLTFVFSSWYSGPFLYSCDFLVCHMAILVNLTRRILFAHCAFDVAVSPPRFPAHWLPFASFRIRLLSCFGFGLLAAVWEDFFSSDSPLAQQKSWRDSFHVSRMILRTTTRIACSTMLRFPLCYVCGCARYRILCFVRAWVWLACCSLRRFLFHW